MASPSICKVSLSTKGVTYTACSNRVMQKLKELDFIGEFAVNFVQINAVVELFDKDQTNDLATAITDPSYDTMVDELTEMTEEGRAQLQSRVRTVEIQIDGFYCGHCLDLATSRLNSFLAIELLSRTTLQKAVLKIKYAPEVPNVTIRQFQAAKD